MSVEELQKQIDDGVEFWNFTGNGRIIGVMVIQDNGEVMLIRHVYVRTVARGKGIRSKLLTHLYAIAITPVLIGTWADATWAISFYEKHGFRLLAKEEKK